LLGRQNENPRGDLEVEHSPWEARKRISVTRNTPAPLGIAEDLLLSHARRQTHRDSSTITIRIHDHLAI